MLPRIAVSDLPVGTTVDTAVHGGPRFERSFDISSYDVNIVIQSYRRFYTLLRLPDLGKTL